MGIAGAGAQYAKSLGADVVLDYRSETDLVSAIQKASPTPVKHAYDAISHPPTTSTIAKVLSANGGGRLTTVLPTPEETEPEKAGKPANVVLDRTMVGSAHKDDSEFASRWIRTFARWIPEGKFKGNVVKVIPGGLAGVPEGLKLLEENKVSGAKLVCKCRVF